MHLSTHFNQSANWVFIRWEILCKICCKYSRIKSCKSRNILEIIVFKHSSKAEWSKESRKEIMLIQLLLCPMRVYENSCRSLCLGWSISNIERRLVKKLIKDISTSLPNKWILSSLLLISFLSLLLFFLNPLLLLLFLFFLFQFFSSNII